MNDYLEFLFGIVCAGIGGELFVRGLVGLARWARISPAIMGATVAAFATSSPELFVGINAGLNKTPAVSFGDALGSNIVNVGLILGLTLTIGTMRSSRAELKRDFPAALLVPVVIGVFVLDGVVSRLEGVFLLSLFATWTVAVVLEVRRQRGVADKVMGECRHSLAIVLCVAGLALLMLAGHFIVIGAKGLAVRWGLGTFVVGQVVVALGTSVPELATAVISKMRGHDEVGVGTILGSNIFNCLWIVGIVAILCPIVVPFREVVLALVFGIVTTALVFPTRRGLIERRRGFLLLLLYALYVIVAL